MQIIGVVVSTWLKGNSSMFNPKGQIMFWILSDWTVGWIDYGMFIQWNATQHWKTMGCILLNVTKWKSHKYYEQKRSDTKEYNIVWFNLCHEQDRQNLSMVVEVE